MRGAETGPYGRTSGQPLGRRGLPFGLSFPAGTDSPPARTEGEPELRDGHGESEFMVL